MKKQPVIDVPKTGFAKFLDIITMLIFIAAIVYLIFEFPGLPDRVPGHYNSTGSVDRWGSKKEMLILPIVGIGLWIMMTIMEKYPHTYNYLNLTPDNAEAQYRNGKLMMNVLKNECVLLFSFLIFQGIRIATGEAEDLGSLMLPIFLAVILGSLLIFMIRMFRL